MIYEQPLFGVIAEWKDQSALIMEGNPTNYANAYERMEGVMKNQNCIRAAMFRMTHAAGHEGLIPKESEGA